MDKLLEIVKLTHSFTNVERTIYYPKSSRFENDSEHSFQLAFIAWYLLSTNNFNLNSEKVFKLALSHDLVEVYAGDTFFYSDTSEQDKIDKEQKAADRLETEFPDFSEIHVNIHEYKNKSSNEAKFVYVLDKIIPILNIYLDEGRTWKEKKITLKMLLEKKVDKIGIFPDLKLCFDEIVKVITSNEKTLFHQK